MLRALPWRIECSRTTFVLVKLSSMTRSYFRRLLAISALVLIPGCFASASTVLLRDSLRAGQKWSVETYTGPAEVTVSPVRSSPSVTILVLVDTVSPAALEQAKTALLDFFPPLRGHPTQLALLRKDQELTGPVPVSTRQRLKQLLDKAVSGEDAAVLPSAGVIDDLLAVISKFGPKGSTLLLVGELPKLDAASSDFAAALLAKAFAAQQLQVSLFSPGTTEESWAPLFRSLGGEVIQVLRESALARTGSADFLFQLDWTTPPPFAGFVVSHSIISDEQAKPASEVADLAVAEGATIPTVHQYAEIQKKITDAVELLNEEPLTQARADQVRQNIQDALELNPRDSGALLAAASLYEKAKDYHAAAAMSAFLVEVRPRDGPTHATFGHALRLNSEFDRAEEELKRAAELGVRTPQINEDFARIHVARKDDKGALPYSQEVLRMDPKRQDVWFFQGEVAEKAQDSTLAIHSYEQGLALGGVHVAEAGTLIRLYLAAKHADQAEQLAKRQLDTLPPEPAPRIELAAILDDLQQNVLALRAWRRVLEVQSSSERAHARVARLTLEQGDAPGAEQAAIAGLAAVPTSATLYLCKADAQEAQGRRYEARSTLREGIAVIQDPTLQARAATNEERYAGGAPEAYARLAELSKASSAEQVGALERGFHVSMRDGDLEHADKFATSLEAHGRREFRALLAEVRPADSRVLVPGGLNALAFAARTPKEEVPPERFFLEYCRTLISHNVELGENHYADGLRRYFERVAALQALGKRGASGVTITLSLNGKEARRQTEKALNILGINLRSSKGEVALARGEKKTQAIKQETASALALDEVGIQEALQSGKSYQLEIPDEPASVHPSEQFWREAFYSKSGDPGGFAEALVRMPRLARLYVSLNSMDRAAATELLKTLSLQDLYAHDSDLLFQYAPALALEGTHAAVPGGLPAEAIWTSLSGTSPAQPGPFFRALLKRDDGRLLAFFSILSQLDRAHQAFFTASEGRTRQFYDRFTSIDEMHTRPYNSLHDSGFRRMLRSVPLDAEGHISFPGSPEVWTVAKGHSSSQGQTAHLMKKVHKATAPGLEDELLVHLGGIRYAEKNARLTELDNFLAVSWIDGHRSKPMDEESALLLAQRYADFSAAYPYFTDLRSLTAEDYHQFFAAIDRIAGHSPLDANLQLGQLYSLTEWICLLVQRNAIQDVEAARLFRSLADRFAVADDDALYSSASLESARDIISACARQITAPADDALRSCLLGPHASPRDERAKDFGRVLDSQHVPSLTALLSIYDAAAQLSTEKKVNDSLTAVQKGVENLPTVDLPKEIKVSGKEKSAILRYGTAPLRKIAAQLREKAAKRRPNPKDMEKLAQELRAELQPQVTAALAGPLYAFFLRSTDLIVANDSLLLRKHHYFDFSLEFERQKIVPSDFNPTSEAAGSYFLGGFAQFAYAAGLAAVHSKDLSNGSMESAAAQIATLRSTGWDLLDESDQRLTALRIVVAREWIYEAARKPEILRALGEETVGLLSLSRRADLLNGIASRSWREVWNSITTPELLALGGRYSHRFKAESWPSEAAASLRSVEGRNNGSRLNILGAIPYHIFGCNHPHLHSDAPYEEYEHHFPAEMGERSAEFKIFLVFQADRLGLQPGMLGQFAEKLALKAFRKAQMTDYRDWRSLLNAYASMDTKDLQQELKDE